MKESTKPFKFSIADSVQYMQEDGDYSENNNLICFSSMIN